MHASIKFLFSILYGSVSPDEGIVQTTFKMGSHMNSLKTMPHRHYQHATLTLKMSHRYGVSSATSVSSLQLI